MSINLIVSIIAFFVAIVSGYFFFRKEQYKFCFDVSSSFSVCFFLYHLKFTLDWNWLCSMALPIAIYTVVIVIVKKIATKGDNSDA